MLDVLAIFEKLSEQAILDKKNASENFESLSISMQIPSIEKDSKILRSLVSRDNYFSDGVEAFNYC